MDALVDIGTPQAALALQPLLWTDDPNAYHAAWCLAALLPLAGVEDALQTITLTPEQRKAKQIEWIWEPFSDNVILQAVVGRIAYLLHATPENELLLKNLPCDPRLIIPLCAIVAQDSRTKKMGKEKRQRLQERIGEDKKSRLIPFKPELPYEPMDEQKQKSIVKEFADDISVGPKWKYLYSMLSVSRQLALLLALAQEKIQPSIEDWQNIFKPINYGFSKSWHVKILKLLFLLPLIFNFLDLWNRVEQSSAAVVFTLATIIISFVLLGGMIFVQSQKWTIGTVTFLFIVTFLGLAEYLRPLLHN